MKRLLAILLPAVVTVGAAAPAAASPTQVRSALGHARAPAGQVERRAFDRRRGMSFFRYRQEVGGLPVLGGEAVVPDARGVSGDLLLDATRRLRAPRKPTVTRARALREA